jgi:hypothetical protein
MRSSAALWRAGSKSRSAHRAAVVVGKLEPAGGVASVMNPTRSLRPSVTSAAHPGTIRPTPSAGYSVATISTSATCPVGAARAAVDVDGERLETDPRDGFSPDPRSKITLNLFVPGFVVGALCRQT